MNKFGSIALAIITLLLFKKIWSLLDKKFNYKNYMTRNPEIKEKVNILTHIALVVLSATGLTIMQKNSIYGGLLLGFSWSLFGLATKRE